MNDYFLALIFLLLAVGGVVVRKTYYYLPVRELKRRAEQGDPLAARLYPAVSYGGSLRVLLWLYIGLMSAVTIVLLARALPLWAGLLIVGPLLWAVFSWLPASRVTGVGMRLTALATPLIVWILNYAHPFLSRGSEAVRRRTTTHNHTGIFERDDLVKLIEQQQRQHDSKLREDELEIARRALNFGEYKVSDILVPRKATKIVSTKDTIGPVLIDELHKNGQGYMLVRETPKGEFVGTVAFSQLNLETSGQVKNIMDKNVYYLHENDSLSQALHAFSATHKPVFIVVNSFEEYVGIVTIEGILRQLLGHIPGEDFEQYHDKQTVANRHPSQKQKAKKPEAEPRDKNGKSNDVKIAESDNTEPETPAQADKTEATSGKADEEMVE